MLYWIIENTIVTGVLALCILAVCRFQRQRPALCHWLWVLVLVRLLLPPLPIPSLTSGLLASMQKSDEPTSLPVESPLVMAGPERPFPDSEFQQAFREPDGQAVSRSGAEGEEGHAALGEILAKPTDTGLFSIRVSLFQGLLLLWALGGLTVLVTQLRRMFRFRTIIRRDGVDPSETLSREVESVARRLGVMPPRVIVLPCIGTPFIWSLSRPVLLWPAVKSVEEDAVGARSILAHEMAHLRRKDHWFSWLELTGMCLWWWHPLYWLSRARIRQYAELSSDAWAVWAYPKHRRAYAKALIDVAARVSAPPSAVVAFAATHADYRNFERRLTMIMRRGVSRKSSPYWMAGAVLLMLTALPSLSQKTKAPTPDSVKWTKTNDQALDSVIEAEVLKNRAKRAFKAEDWSLAADLYQSLVERFDDKNSHHFKLGHALQMAGRDEEAVTAFKRSLERGDRVAASYYQLALIHAKRDSETALNYLEEGVRAGFKDAESLMEADFGALAEDARFLTVMKNALMQKKRTHVAEKAFDQGEWDKVIELYREVLATAPNFARGYSRLGFAQIRAERFQDGLETFRTQIAMNHRVAVATYNIGCIHALTGEGDKAVQYLEKAVELGFNDPGHFREDSDLDGIRDLAGYQALWERISWRDKIGKRVKTALDAQDVGELETLLSEYGERADLGHDMGGFFGKIGYALHEAGRHQAASEAFKRQARTGHNVGKALYNLACASARMGDHDQAFIYLENAVAAGFHNHKHIAADSDLETLRDDPRFETMAADLAAASELRHFKTKDWRHLHQEAAKKSLKKPEDGAAQHKLGWALLRQGEIDQALEAFLRQDELGYSPKTAKYNIACCYAIKGDNDQAFAWLKKAVGAGFKNIEHLRTDRDLANLREDPRFDSLLKHLN